MNERDARCCRCDEIVGTVVIDQGRATIRLSTSTHGDTPPISCPRVNPPEPCSTCDGTGSIPWMHESDPNFYQEPDDEGRVSCPDCRLRPAESPAESGGDA